jgi:hypothetical protein
MVNFQYEPEYTEEELIAQFVENASNNHRYRRNL